MNRPYPRKLPTKRPYWVHFAKTWIATFFALMTTLYIGSMFGELTGVVPPDMGTRTVMVAMGHYILLVMLFSLMTSKEMGVRINPYLTLTMFLEQPANYAFYIVEMIAQATATVGAAALVYGVLSATPPFLPGIGGDIINTQVGWAFFMEAVAGFALGFVYHHIRHDTVQFPTLFAFTIAFTMFFTYPFLGPTTHNPYRWLSACIIEGTCNSYGSWVYPVAPIIGIFVGWLFQKTVK